MTVSDFNTNSYPKMNKGLWNKILLKNISIIFEEMFFTFINSFN